MADGSAFTLATVALALAAAGLVKGATGIGYATCALPLLTALLGLKIAMALVVLPAMAANIGLAIGGGHLRETLQRYAPVYAAMLPGVAAGAVLLAAIDARSAVPVLGAALLGYTAYALARPALRISEPAARRLAVPAGLASGVLTGLTGSQVVPLVPFMMAAEPEPARAIQAINVGVLVLSSALALALAVTEPASPLLLVGSALAVVPALAGSAAGAALRDRLPARTARALVLVVLGTIGAKMLFA